jgi:hypothetical protein
MSSNLGEGDNSGVAILSLGLTATYDIYVCDIIRQTLQFLSGENDKEDHSLKASVVERKKMRHRQGIQNTKT